MEDVCPITRKCNNIMLKQM
uniref:Uncharacterized protein n=1 Tax=Rhizophora mucronata TaxID=61149 RepID=A0A2P2QJP3_RHIMU